MQLKNLSPWYTSSAKTSLNFLPSEYIRCSTDKRCHCLSEPIAEFYRAFNKFAVVAQVSLNYRLKRESFHTKNCRLVVCLHLQKLEQTFLKANRYFSVF